MLLKCLSILLLMIAFAPFYVSGEDSEMPAPSQIFVQASPGSFNQQAIGLLLQDSINSSRIQFCGTPLNTFQLAADNKSLAFVAIKNTLIPKDFVKATLTALQEFKIVKIISSIQMKIEMAHLRHQEAFLNNLPITQIASHPAALQQIVKWKDNYPLITEIPIPEGTAEAARQLSFGELSANVSVIGSSCLAQHYPNLVVIEDSIQDCEDNYTTFILVEIANRPQQITEDEVIAELNSLLT